MRQILLLFFTFLFIKTTAQDLNSEANAKVDSIRNSFSEYNNDLFGLTLKEFQYSSYKSWTLTQFKNLNVSLEKESISLIERLNGIEWKGTIKISADAVRSIYWTTGYTPYFSEAPKNQSIWSEWISFENWIIIIIKKRGTWRIRTRKYFKTDEIPNKKPLVEEIQELYTHQMKDESSF